MLTVNIASFSYAEKPVLKNISFSIEKGKHFAILGESGCGKTTLLHLIYGLLQLDHGTVSWNGKKLAGPSHTLILGEKDMKLVFQQPDLMPYTTVAENMGSHLRGPDHRKHKVRIQQLVAIMGLRGLEKTKVNALSGGQQQRVAIAKALAQIPAVLLLDEAFGNIDTFRKNMLRRHIFEFAERNNITCITATHDSGEALEFADTVLILKNGTVETMGTPVSIFGNLSNGYRAGFFGDFSTLPASLFNKGAAPGKNLFLLSHQLKISASETLIKVSVVKCYFKGSHYVVAAVHNGETVYFHHPRALPAGSVHYLERC